MKLHLHLRKLKAKAIIGVYSYERKKPRWIYLSLRCEVPVDSEDQLKHGVCYESLAKSLKQWIEQSSFHLLESLAKDLLQRLYQTFPIQSAYLSLEKPRILSPLVNSVIVEIESSAQDFQNK